MTDTGIAAPPRLHFLDAQRRHRRTSAVSAALVVVALDARLDRATPALELACN
jgi:hypothetical protein